ncbi:transketolase family protein [Thermodesulfovibrio sp. 3907-1M]|uniref:Transketolase family protein n=1 Tax=Thermodesulfovibrio autotrophicus TaxID=3118333 RepID=A0AAU8GZ49_9BACT
MQNRIATRQAYGLALVDLGKNNPNVVVLDADLSKSTYTVKFAKEFPERFFNAGVAEANMIGMAAGLATCGFIVFASTFAIFATQRALNQIFQSIAYPELNVKIAASHAGITVGEDGASHQSIDDISIMKAIPGMTVIVPADSTEAYQATIAAARHFGPVYLRLSRAPTPQVLPEDYTFKIGKACVLREGSDVTIVACGTMVYEAMAAAEKLLSHGISAEIINMSTVKPIDRETLLNSVMKTGCVVTAEEHSVIGGLGDAVCAVISEEYPCPVRKIGVKDQFGQSGKPEELLKVYGLTSDDIVQIVLNLKGGRV